MRRQGQCGLGDEESGNKDEATTTLVEVIAFGVKIFPCHSNEANSPDQDAIVVLKLPLVKNTCGFKLMKKGENFTSLTKEVNPPIFYFFLKEN